MTKTIANQSQRFLSLDYLRGWFICIIIIDHLWLWPSFLIIFTGKAELWMTAAEGFVILAGFLVGYVRGYKSIAKPFIEVIKKLISRSLVLWLWAIIGSVFYLFFAWQENLKPMWGPEIAKNDWTSAWWEITTLQQPYAWVYFLAIYALIMLLAIPFIAMLRKRLTLLVFLVSAGLYILGINLEIKWLIWQIIFVIPMIIGFYFPAIKTTWDKLDLKKQKNITISIHMISLISLVLSVASNFYPNTLPGNLSHQLKDLFFIDYFYPPRLIITTFWFMSLFFIFQKLLPILQNPRWNFLYYIGTHSLTAYICHGIAIMLIINLLPNAEEISLPISPILLNTIYGIFCIFITYIIIKIPIIKRFIPR